MLFLLGTLPAFSFSTSFGVMHDTSGSVSTENDDASKNLKLGNSKDTTNSAESHSATQPTKDVQEAVIKAETVGADRNGSENRVGPMETGVQTQQSGSLNGENDTVMDTEAGEASMMDQSDEEASKKLQSTPATQNGDTTVDVVMKQEGGDGPPGEAKAGELNGEGPVAAGVSTGR